MIRHDFTEQLDYLIVIGFAGIAREAGVGHGVGRQLSEVLRHQTIARVRNLHVSGQLAHSVDAASAASCALIPETAVPMARATSVKRSAHTGLLNSMGTGSNIAHATPCGVS